jgi:single-strand DNA-binding protein
VNQQNFIVIEGNAVRDAEIKSTGTGAGICKMSIAVNRWYKSGENFEKEVSYFDIDCFGDVAKLCAEKVKKGDEIRVTGRLKQSRWTQDGMSRSAVVIIAERVEFAMKTKGNQSGGSGDDDGF